MELLAHHRISNCVINSILTAQRGASGGRPVGDKWETGGSWDTGFVICHRNEFLRQSLSLLNSRKAPIHTR
jgi:hypothetical protein